MFEQVAHGPYRLIITAIKLAPNKIFTFYFISHLNGKISLCFFYNVVRLSHLVKPLGKHGGEGQDRRKAGEKH